MTSSSKKDFFSIKNEIFLWFLILSLTPLGLATFIAYQNGSSTLYIAAQNALEKESNLTTLFIENWFDYRITDLSHMTRIPQNVELLNSLAIDFQKKNLSLSDYIPSKYWEKLVRSKNTILGTYLEEYDYIHDILLIDTNGNILYTVKKENDLGTNLISGQYSNTKLSIAFKKSLQSNSLYFSGIEKYAPSNNRTTSFIVKPVHDKLGNIIGAFAIQLYLTRIRNLINSRVSEQTNHYILTQNGEVIAPVLSNNKELEKYSLVQENNKKFNLELINPTKYMSSGLENLRRYINSSGELVIGVHKKINLQGSSWYLISEMKETTALAQTNELTALVIKILAITMFIVILLALFVSRRITRPILNLADTATKITKGYFSKKSVEYKNDEIGILARSLDKMLLKRRVAEDELRQAYNENKKILSSLTEQKFAFDQHSIVAVTDLNGLITYANDKFCEISEYSEQEILGNSHRIVNSNYHPKAFFTQMFEVIRQGKVWHGEIRNQSKTGIIYWVDTTIVPTLDADKQPISYIAIRSDITERKRIQKLVEESEERYDLAMSVANDGIWDWNIDKNEVIFDKRYYTLAGYNDGEFPQKFEEWEARVHPNDLNDARETIEQYLKNKIPFFITEFRFRRKDNSYMWIRGKGKIVEYSRDRSPLRMIGTHSDISEEIEAKEKLQRNRNMLASLVNTIPYGIHEIDLQGIIILANPAALKIMMFSHDDLVGRHIWDFEISDEKKNELSERFQETIRNEPKPEIINTERIRKDGSKVEIEVVWDYRRDEYGKVRGLISIVTDVTNRNQSQKALQRAQKMEAVGQLTGGLAHDFNNILGIIIGNLGLLENQFKNDLKVTKRLNSASSAAERAEHLTKQLLDFSRKDATEGKLSNINNLIDGINEIIRYSLGIQFNFSFEKGRNLWITKIDQGDLQDALINLIRNARDAMQNQENGLLSVTTSNILVDQEFHRNNFNAKPGEYVKISISDNGEGISSSDLSQIFDPFFTTKSQGKGTGLGLAMVFGFINRSNGFIQVNSELSKGTTFELYLPRSMETEEVNSMEEVIDTEKMDLSGNETILIVDDEIGLVELAKETLEILGYNILTASDAELALKELENTLNIDLLFSDVIMPGSMNGFELAEKAFQRYPKLKVLLTSGYTGKAELKQSKQQIEQFDILEKPYSQDYLAYAIREQLGNIKMLEHSEIASSDNQNLIKLGWQTELGIDVLDEDHKVLDKIYINFNTAIKDNAGNLSTILDEILEVTKKHFEREEAIMEVCDYPDFKNHKQVHSLLLKEMESMKAKLSKEELSYIEISKFLSNWVIQHIAAMDSKIVPFTKGKENLIQKTLRALKMSQERASKND